MIKNFSQIFFYLFLFSRQVFSQTDVAISYPLGGGVSVFAELRSVSGDTGTDTSSTSNSTMAIGSSITF